MLLATPTLDMQGGYMSSAFAKPAIVQYASGSTPEGSDPGTAALVRLTKHLSQIEDTLLVWYRDPSAVADDDTESPSQTAISQSLRHLQAARDWLAASARDGVMLVPRGVSIGTGGSISIEFSDGSLAVTVRVEPDGQSEMLVFADDRLIRRMALPPI